MAQPNYRIEIVKELFGEQWANDWMTDVVGMNTAQDLASEILSFERAIHQTRVNFLYILISTTLPEDRVFRHIPLNQNGQFISDEYIPLFNTVRLDMATEDSDPCRKYFRLPIGENRITNGILNSDYVGLLNTAWNSYMITGDVFTHIVSGAGNNVLSGAFHLAVQMRQLHRRRRPVEPA